MNPIHFVEWLIDRKYIAEGYAPREIIDLYLLER